MNKIDVVAFQIASGRDERSWYVLIYGGKRVKLENISE